MDVTLYAPIGELLPEATIRELAAAFGVPPSWPASFRGRTGGWESRDHVDRLMRQRPRGRLARILAGERIGGVP
jgi:hypothetical protein